MTRSEQLADTIPPPPPTVPAPASIKTCRCGRELARDEWDRLRLVGFQEDGENGKFELRDCDACGSTLAMRKSGAR